MVNVPPYDLAFEKRVSEATMCYYKRFWETQKFNNQDIGDEGVAFLKKRNLKNPEIDWKGIIVALLHGSNTSMRRDGMEEPNGWHFDPIPDELFIFLTESLR